MSSDNNRTRVLIGFGALAIVVIAAIALWPPNFRSEEASGAIGVVQKHHAPQIAQKDVILGNEKTRQEQKLRYADFFTDAAKLQTISASLAAAAASRTNVASIAQEMQTQSAELNARYTGSFTEALAEAEMLSKHAGNAELESEVAELASKFKNDKELSSADMEQYNSKLAEIEEQMQAKTAAKVLKDADHELAAAVAEMQNQSEQAASKLQDVEQALNAKMTNISLADREEYLAQIAMEAKVLGEVEAAMAGSFEYSKLADFGEQLASRGEQLEQKALQNIEAELASEAQLASALNDMEAQLASEAQLAHAAFNKQLGNIKQELAERDQELQAHAAASAEAELASLRSYAESRMQFAKLANTPEMESKLAGAKLQNAEFNARLANTVELQNHLASIERALANQDLASKLSNETQLAAQVAQLENQLQAKKH